MIRVIRVICQGSYHAVSDLAHDVRFDLPDVTVFDLHMTELTGLAVRPHVNEVRVEICRTRLFCSRGVDRTAVDTVAVVVTCCRDNTSQ